MDSYYANGTKVEVESGESDNFKDFIGKVVRILEEGKYLVKDIKTGKRHIVYDEQMSEYDRSKAE